jgi:uncharacterized protein YndB with AHSA1/START domain
MAMADSRTATVTLPTDEQILITRQFDAPRHLVYRAWTTPDLVRRWWSGHRGEMTVVEMDLRVGGAWRYAMVADGGFEVAFHGEYREIVPDERLVTTEVFEMPGASDADAALNIVSFIQQDGRTRLELLVQCKDIGQRDAIVQSGMEDGLQEQMEILDGILASLR